MEGSRYLFEGDWVKGFIIKPSGYKTEELEFRYDKNRQELGVKIAKERQPMVLLVPPKNVFGFTVIRATRSCYFVTGSILPMINK